VLLFTLFRHLLVRGEANGAAGARVEPVYVRRILLNREVGTLAGYLKRGYPRAASGDRGGQRHFQVDSAEIEFRLSSAAAALNLIRLRSSPAQRRNREPCACRKRKYYSRGLL
jgi:hypothetical protein